MALIPVAYQNIVIRERLENRFPTRWNRIAITPLRRREFLPFSAGCT